MTYMYKWYYDRVIKIEEFFFIYNFYNLNVDRISQFPSVVCILLNVSRFSDFNQHCRACCTSSDSRLPCLHCWRNDIVKLPPSDLFAHHDKVCDGWSSFPCFRHFNSRWKFPCRHLVRGGHLPSFCECHDERRNSSFRPGFGTQVLGCLFWHDWCFVYGNRSDMWGMKLFLLVWSFTAMNCRCSEESYG